MHCWVNAFKATKKLRQNSGARHILYVAFANHLCDQCLLLHLDEILVDFGASSEFEIH